MSHHRSADAEELNIPIDVFSGNTILDGGIATAPESLLRFARYLDCGGGRQLNDRQLLVLVMVIGLRKDRTLRLANLPLTASMYTLRDDLALFRRAGLVFTSRDYYPVVNGKPPRLRAQVWDVRPLIANIEAIQYRWTLHQAKLEAKWRTRGERGPRPVYEFSPDFRHHISVPRVVLEDIGVKPSAYYPLPDKWLDLIQATFTAEEIAALRATRAAESPTEVKTLSRRPRTEVKTLSRGAPTEAKTLSHLEEDEEEEEKTPSALKRSSDPIIGQFCALKGRTYEFTGKDLAELSALREAHYSDDQILSAIKIAFKRSSQPQRFALVARIAREKFVPEAGSAASPKPDRRKSENGQPEVGALENLPELTEAAALLKSLGSNTPAPSLAQLVALAKSCDPTAQTHGATGAAWVLRALRLSLQASNVARYLAATLDDWIEHGPPSQRSRPRRSNPPTAKSADGKSQWDEAYNL